MSPQTGHRLLSLDVLRAVAILLVMGEHMKPPTGMYGPVLGALMQTWVRGGWVGVDLFFVLSGFLVSGLLFREYQRTHTVSVRRFLIRRGLKIYPAFYVFLTISVIAEKLFRTNWVHPGWRTVLAEALFVQNYWTPFFGHSWSLAVEEHFYLLCAGLLFYLARRRAAADPFRAIVPVFVWVAALSLIVRLLNGWLVVPYANPTHLYRTHLRLDGLVFGVVLSYLYHFRRDVLRATIGARPGLAIALGIALLLPAFMFQRERTFLIYTVGLTGFYLGSGLLVVALTLVELRPSLVVRGLAFLGAYSYSIYLWHVSVQQSLDLAQTSSGLAQWHFVGFFAYVAASVLVGALMATLVEMPILRLRDRLFPAKNAPMTTRPAPSSV